MPAVEDEVDGARPGPCPGFGLRHERRVAGDAQAVEVAERTDRDVAALDPPGDAEALHGREALRLRQIKPSPPHRREDGARERVLGAGLDSCGEAQGLVLGEPPGGRGGGERRAALGQGAGLVEGDELDPSNA